MKKSKLFKKKHFVILWFRILFIDIKLRFCNLYKYLEKLSFAMEKKNIKKYSLKDENDLKLAISDSLILVEKTSSYYPGAKCLHRAILNFEILRGEFGLPVKLRVGVKKYPFLSHAWVAWNVNNRSVIACEEDLEDFKIVFDSLNRNNERRE